MNWDAVFITLGSVSLIVAGLLLVIGPLFIEENLRSEDRKNAYCKGAVVVPTLIIAGALLLGLGVPTG
ncbi:hypothetical protein BJF89_13795 [Corynebacterium sp. CNJ-954]|uniref:hypothetical protein n=1 Tax=Corynebacterium sp. CNJ-954 TaxID=1904962 RepID=UPI00095CB108|nr:hypothetical protein [Corynebacterium sp. CNJ-954]OLT55855.1 hypothetical protein BJF89_13795 [Corynebacterium sp. CNJ-954]